MKTRVQPLASPAIAGWICAAYWFCASAGSAISAEATADSATQAATVASATFATNVTEVIHLSESGVEEEVILAFIEDRQTSFALSA